MIISWTREANLDITGIYSYIAKDSLIMAVRVTQSIVTFTTKQLETFPMSGFVGRVVDTRELIVPKLPYFISYRINEDTIEILRVYHMSRLWSEQ